MIDERTPGHWRSKGIDPETVAMTVRYWEGLQVCQICRRSEPTGHNWVIDHDHQYEPNAPVRGILCSNCNSGLGFFGDEPARLRAAVKYLENAPRPADWHRR